MVPPEGAPIVGTSNDSSSEELGTGRGLYGDGCPSITAYPPGRETKPRPVPRIAMSPPGSTLFSGELRDQEPSLAMLSTQAGPQPEPSSVKIPGPTIGK